MNIFLIVYYPIHSFPLYLLHLSHFLHPIKPLKTYQ
nr:MAG TPA: hypothetical protein [Caudoviricetes sp.]